MKRWKTFAACVLCLCMIAAGSGISMQEVHAAEEKVLEITDNYPDLDGWLTGIGSTDTVKITCTAVGAGQTVLPAQVTLLSGWDKSFFGDNGPATRQIGYNSGSFTFAEDSDVTVQYIEFNMPEKSITVPAGVSVVFDNCTFSSTIVNNGTATFNDCIFSNGKIENNGSAQYTGGTKEPENTGTPIPSHIPLGMNLTGDILEEAAVGTEYFSEIGYEVTGTNKDSAQIAASVSPADCGITVRTEGTAGKGSVILSGTPVKAGNVKVTLTAEADGDTPVSKELSLVINERMELRLDGTLDCVTKGQSGYQEYLKVYVRTADEKEIDYYDYDSDSAELQVRLTPEGSGMTAYYLYDGIVVSGTPEKAGTYQVTAVLKDKGQTVVSNSAELRIYRGDETLKEQFEGLDENVSEWDMEPYEIWTSDNAVVPTNLETIYGSHESGLYGIIGNNKSVASDTLVIPAGCDVTFENIKIYSSVKIIVEKGGSLTLRDSVAYGPIEVNGGTFSMDHYAAITDTLTLNDGSVLKDAQVISNARFLTDGAKKDDVGTVVIINGTVTASGTNYIEGDCGSGDLAGQTALQVNGTLVIPSGSSLTAAGGGDETYAPGHTGGIGVYLNGGTVSGGGKLVAIGGVGNDGSGGDAIAGKGRIETNELECIGGDSQKIIDREYAGGDAVGEEVIVTTADPVLKGGSGDPDGTAFVTMTEDPGDRIPDGNGNTSGSREPGENTDSRTDEDKYGEKAEAAVKTGDGAETLSWFLTLAAAGMVSAALFAARRKIG